MKLLVLGKGKTGALVTEIARERGHEVRAVGSAENVEGAALTGEALSGIDIVIDFTTPDAVVANIARCATVGVNMVVGTTGWYSERERVRKTVEESGIGLLYAANFSVGVNVFFDIARVAGALLKQDYEGHIIEVHHAQKKDAPSGTAAALQGILRESGGKELEITSLREGDIVGQHMIVLDSPQDSITLMHAAKSRRAFAQGAVLAAEWMQGRRGFFEFRDMLRALTETSAR